jgi:protein SCO1
VTARHLYTRSRAAAALALAAVVAGCGASAGPSDSATADGPGLQGLILKPAKQAPALALHNYTGARVSLAALRGKAVLVTFVYTHCPNVCPLIVADLAAAQRGLGAQAARELQVVAVTVDPRRDTPSAIRTFLRARDALGRLDYLIGSRAQLLPVWKAWDVGVSVDTKQVIAGHTAIIYGVSASGRLAVAYPSNVTPPQLIHDVPLLARM